MRHYQKGFAHIILLLIVLLGSIASLFYFSWKNNLLKITPQSQDEVKEISEVIYEWEKVKPNEKTKDFGSKNKLGYIKLGKGELWLVNEDGTGEFLFQNEVSTSAAISPNGKYIAFLKG